MSKEAAKSTAHLVYAMITLSIPRWLLPSFFAGPDFGSAALTGKLDIVTEYRSVLIIASKEMASPLDPLLAKGSGVRELLVT